MTICWNQNSVNSLVNVLQLFGTGLQYTQRMVLHEKPSYMYVDNSDERYMVKVVRKKVSRQSENRHFHQIFEEAIVLWTLW